MSKHEAQIANGLCGTAWRQGVLLTVADEASPLDAAGQARAIAQVAEMRDRQAFALLFKHFAPRLKAFHLRAGLSAAAAEELAQETMLTLWRKAGQFDAAKASAATWIFAITRNLRIDLARRQRGTPPQPPAEEEAMAPTAEAGLLAAEQAARMRVAMATLSGEQRQVIEMSFFTDTPHAAIAEALGLPLGTVKSRIRLALARLRAALGPES